MFLNDSTNQFRTEQDTLGDIKIPANAYYGSQTQRAFENFQISGVTLPHTFIRAQGIIKAAAAKTNMKIGELDKKIAKAIIKASEEVIDGKWNNHFIVDVYQAGAGTSQNMNANEVIANRANEILGISFQSDKRVHPNDHVNMNQSTNDTFPTALNIAVFDDMTHKFSPALSTLYEQLEKKSHEFKNIKKSGRTHLHDAVPIRLGQEFSGYAGTVKEIITKLEIAKESLLVIGIGGTAIGTTANLNKDYIPNMIKELSILTNNSFRCAENMFSFMQNRNEVIHIMSILKELSIHLIKITSDLRLLSSGPRTGLSELSLPSVQPGSTIMPGKVNPAILEMTHMVCCQILGYETAVSTAGLSGQLEINVMMPVIAYSVLQSIEILGNAISTLTSKCIEGIEANEEICRIWMEASLARVTGLRSQLGYDLASQIGKQADEEQNTIEKVLKETGLWSKELEKAIDPDNMI